MISRQIPSGCEVRMAPCLRALAPRVQRVAKGTVPRRCALNIAEASSAGNKIIPAIRTYRDDCFPAGWLGGGGCTPIARWRTACPPGCVFPSVTLVARNAAAPLASIIRLAGEGTSPALSRYGMPWLLSDGSDGRVTIPPSINRPSRSGSGLMSRRTGAMFAAKRIREARTRSAGMWPK